MKALFFLLMILCGCGAPADGSDLGSLEQPIWTHGTASPYIVVGVCMNAHRDMCRANAACPGNVPCIVPSTREIIYTLWGDDSPQLPGTTLGTRWHIEVDRLLNLNALGAGFSGEYEGSWSSTKTLQLPAANVVFQRGTCPCVTAGCDKMQDLVCFLEPSSANRTVLSAPAMVGTFVRPKLAVTRRYVTFDIDKVWSYRALLGWADREVHFVLEHMARWSTFTIMGAGSYWNVTPPYTDTSPSNSLMAANTNNGFGGLDGYNAENWVEQWEECLLGNYDPTIEPSAYRPAPVGCSGAVQ